MRALVTGSAGFIGSHLCDALLAHGHTVLGVDRFSAYYAHTVKEANIETSLQRGLDLRVEDLATCVIEPLLRDVDVVFHLAAQAGVRSSWGDDFSTYTSDNVIATQRLLEACKERGNIRLVFASSSSVYGEHDSYPTLESASTHPHSPYGVTKLAAEHLCSLYARNFGVDTVSLRYFTVYGPRQRPDMAFTRLIRAASGGDAFPLYGDGSQIRQFTYVADVVRANLLAATADTPPGVVLNVCGGGEVTLNEAIEVVAELVGREPKLERFEAKPGDVARTGGDGSLAQACLGWTPEVDLLSGLRSQVGWLGATGTSANFS